jgi:gluconate kinase
VQNEHVVRDRHECESAILARSVLNKKDFDLRARGFGESDLCIVCLHTPVIPINQHAQPRSGDFVNPCLLGSQTETIAQRSGAWPVSIAGASEQSVNKRRQGVNNR